jgi:precorrin-6B C5,15-methyltransferase / cobalt-precorrin-6B C5,C15-methyltransferase
VVGIGADGWPGLSGTAVSAVTAAEVVFGSARQLDLLPASVAARREPWPSPLLPALPGLLAAYAGREICVLASGDPMFHGIGATLARLVGPSALRVLPHPSSASLAAARLGWPLAEVEVVSLVSAPVTTLHRLINPGRRILVLGAPPVSEVAAVLVGRGLGDSAITALSQLGSPAETVMSGTAADWPHPPGDPLTVVAIACAAGPAVPVVPGLPDALYDSATAGVVADWMYEQLAAAYVLDPANQAFMTRSNPWALHGITERLLEAADRKLWDSPDPETLAALKQVYLATEGDLEGDDD